MLLKRSENEKTFLISHFKGDHGLMQQNSGCFSPFFLHGEDDWLDDNKSNRTNNSNYDAKANPCGFVKLEVQGGLGLMRAGEKGRLWCPVSI